MSDLKTIAAAKAAQAAQGGVTGSTAEAEVPKNESNAAEMQTTGNPYYGKPAFRGLQLKRFHDSKGVTVKPNAEGVFVAENEDQYNILRSFEKSTERDYVEFIGDKQ